MPICPQCLSEYREGFTRCASCEVDLVDSVAPEMDLSDESVRAALAGKQLVAITRGELQVVKETRELLARKRIPSLIVQDEEVRVPPGMAPRVLLLVGQDDLAGAAELLGEQFRQLLAQEESQVPEAADYGSCPACGAQVPETAEECPECGLYIGKG